MTLKTGKAGALNTVLGITTVLPLTKEEKTQLADKIVHANVLIKDESTNLLYLSDGKTAVKDLVPISSRNNQAICSTASAVAQKDITVPGFSLEPGSIVTVKFANSNTAADAISITINDGEPVPVNYHGVAWQGTVIGNDRYHPFIYDGSAWEYIGDIDVNDSVNQVPITEDNEFPIVLVGDANQTTTQRKGVNFNTNVTVNPSTDTITATNFNGTATRAIADASGNTLTTTYATKSETTNASNTAKEYVDQKIADLVSSSPQTLDTLKELADALGNDPDYATTTAQLIGQKANDSAVVHNTGNETVAGEKTFTTRLTVKSTELDATDSSSGNFIGSQKYEDSNSVLLGTSGLDVRNDVGYTSNGLSVNDVAASATYSVELRLYGDSTATALVPLPTETINLGSQLLKWNNVYAATWNGYVPADDDETVHTSGDEEIAGTKTVTGDMLFKLDEDAVNAYILDNLEDYEGGVLTAADIYINVESDDSSIDKITQDVGK
jgi:hypothetical protein